MKINIGTFLKYPLKELELKLELPIINNHENEPKDGGRKKKGSKSIDDDNKNPKKMKL